MPGRYYFAPIRGRQGSVAAGVADGLERGADNFTRGRETMRRNERQDTEDQRRRLFEDVEMDDFLAQRGGGRGAAPTDDVTLRSSADSPRPEFEMPEFNPSGAGGPGIKAPELTGGFEFDPIEVALEGRPDPRYRSVGPDGYGHVMTPEALDEQRHQRSVGREAETYDRDFGRENVEYQREVGREEEEYGRGVQRTDDERANTVDRLGPIAGSIASGALGREDGEEFGRGFVEFAGSGIDPYSFMPPQPEDAGAWTPNNRDDYFLSRGRDPETGKLVDPRGGSGSGGERTTRPDYEGAIDILTRLYATGEFVGQTSLSNQELHEMALEMSGESGDGNPFADETGGPSRAAMAGYPEASVDRTMRMARERRRNVSDGGAPSAGAPANGAPTRSDGAPAQPASQGDDVRMGPSPEDIEAIRESLSGFPRRQWREILEEENERLGQMERWTDEEIEAVVGGR